MKKIIVIIILSFAFVNAHADETCNRKELNRLKSLAKEITYSYEFNEKENQDGTISGDFTVILDNVSEETKPVIIYSLYEMKYDAFIADKNGRAQLPAKAGEEGFPPGRIVKITVKAYVKGGCMGEDLYVKNIKLPYINPYYNTNSCQLYPKFKYCTNKLTNLSITEKRFNSELERYKADLEKDKPEMKIDNTGLYIMAGVVIFVPLITYSVVKYIKWRKKKEEL